jgi:hypothetical protein
MTILDAALDYIRKGFSVVPVPYRQKGPVIDAWQTLGITDSTAPQYFDAQAQNLGILLGRGQACPTDVDLDSPEAISAAPYLLPPTATFGHASKRASHWIYKTNLFETQDRAAIKFMSAGKAGLLEVRTDGGGFAAQTVFPPSTHVSGEPIAWENNGHDIRQIDGAELLQHASRLAAAAQLALAYPKIGGRHDAAFVLGGFLSRCKFTSPLIKVFAEAVAVVGNQPPDKRRDIIRTAADGADCATPAGLPLLIDTFGEGEAKKVAGWLGYVGDHAGTRTGNGLDDGPCVKGERFTDLGNARRLVRFHGADIRPSLHQPSLRTGPYGPNPQPDLAEVFLRYCRDVEAAPQSNIGIRLDS